MSSSPTPARLLAWPTIAALAALAALNLSMALPTLLNFGPLGRSDYSAFYMAGRATVDRQARHLYQYGAQMQWQRQLFVAPNPALPFNHPAFEALLFAPMALLPFSTSVYGWALLNAVFLLIVVWLLRPYLARGAAHADIILFFSALAFVPAAVALMQGQDSILQLLLFTLAFVDLKQRRDARAGCWLALALIKWHLALPVVVMLALVDARVPFLRRTALVPAFLLTFVAAAAALLALSLAIVGFGGAADYFRLLRFTAGLLDTSDAMPCLYGLAICVLGKPLAAKIVTAIGTLALFALPPVAASPANGADLKDRGAAFDLAFALVVALAILVGYHVNLHDATLLLLPLWILGSDWFERRRWAALAALSFFFLLLLIPAFGLRPRIGLLALPILAVAAAAAWELRRATRCALGRSEIG